MAQKKSSSRHSPDTTHWTATIPVELYEKIVYLSKFEGRNKSDWFRVRIAPVIDRLHKNVKEFERDPKHWTPPGEELFKNMALVDTSHARTHLVDASEPPSSAIRVASRGRNKLLPSDLSMAKPEQILKWIAESEIPIFSEMQQLAAKPNGHPDLVLEYWGRDWPFQATELLKFMEAYRLLWKAKRKSKDETLRLVHEFAWEGKAEAPLRMPEAARPEETKSKEAKPKKRKQG